MEECSEVEQRDMKNQAYANPNEIS
jgi:hypothetical protein